MQWTGDRNGGFSRADPAQLYAPPIMDAVHGYQSINVEAQERMPYSLLNWMKRMIGLRKQSKVFGRGTLEFLSAQNRKVLAYVRRHEEELILCVANLARSVQPVELDLSAFKGMTPVEMLGLTEFPRIGELPYFLTLSPYAFFWFRLQQAPTTVGARLATEAGTSPDHLPAFFMGVAWETLLEGNVRTLIEREALVPFLLRQRWFSGKARSIRAARVIDWGVAERGPHPLFLTIVEVEYHDGGRERYFLPLSILTDGVADSLLTNASHLAMARVTGARKGLVADAVGDEAFGPALLRLLDRSDASTKRGVVRPRRTGAFTTLRGEGPLAARRLTVEQSNTSVTFGERLIVKLFRRIEAGPNPDVEIGEYLTSNTSFHRVPRVAAALEYQPAGEGITHLAVAQEFVASQADGWTYALGELGRFFEVVEGQGTPSEDLLLPTHPLALANMAAPPVISELAGAFIDSAQTLGRRTAELHVALASDSNGAAFAPAPFTREDVERLITDAVAQTRRAKAVLEERLDMLPADIATTARDLLGKSDGVIASLQSKRDLELTAALTRVHGDYHLGQVLWAEGDFYVLDFEGEPGRALAERRQKGSPLKDVAGMLRSFSYAAYAGLFAHTHNRQSSFDRLELWARAWKIWSSAAFLRGYLGVAEGAAFLPNDPIERLTLLDLFLLDKAYYELNYELNNRPDWVRIPLHGILELV